jgi:hypothetical protein
VWKDLVQEMMGYVGDLELMVSCDWLRPGGHLSIII